jgi:phosphatidylinositol alpha 1,6-mannosyltransferase
VKIGVIGESYLPRVNGVSNSVDRVARYLTAQGHEVTVICAGKTEILYQRDFEIIRTSSVQIPTIQDYDFPLTSPRYLKKIFIEKKFDLIHVASPFLLGFMALKVARKLNIPSVAVYQTDVAGFSKYYGYKYLTQLSKFWIRKNHELADLNLVPSKWAWEQLFDLGVTDLQIWGRGVDSKNFNPVNRKNELRNKWNPNAKLYVGYLGRLSPEKCIDKLDLIESNEKIQIVIIGDGPSRNTLERRFPNAIFTGKLVGQDLYEAVASLDVLFATGENETFCQVVQEALSSGLFVFAPEEGAAKELIQHNKSGFIYTRYDQFKINQKLNLFLSFPEILEEISIQNRSQVAINTWEENCMRLLNIYNQLVSVKIHTEEFV